MGDEVINGPMWNAIVLLRVSCLVTHCGKPKARGITSNHCLTLGGIIENHLSEGKDGITRFEKGWSTQLWLVLAESVNSDSNFHLWNIHLKKIGFKTSKFPRRLL
jgi:hypothetical protein